VQVEELRRYIRKNALQAYSLVLGGQSFQKRGAEYYTKSPFREDRHPSLRVNVEEGNWYDDPAGTGGDLIDLYAFKNGLDLRSDFPTIIAGLAEVLGTGTAGTSRPAPRSSAPLTRRGRIAATYDYTDENGTLLSQAVRFEPKGFAQRRRLASDEDSRALEAHGISVEGRWVWSLKFLEADPGAVCEECGGAHRVVSVRQAPYRLPELLAAPQDAPVFVDEGEKDVENLRAIGLVATTNLGGAGKWRSDYNPHFHGRRVVILPDNDNDGREHAREVGRELLNFAFCVKIVELPGLPEKGDVSDWIAAGGTREQLLELV